MLSRGRAGLDVFEDEPAMKPGLAECENAVVVPHIASASLWTRAGMVSSLWRCLQQPAALHLVLNVCGYISDALVAFPPLRCADIAASLAVMDTPRALPVEILCTSLSQHCRLRCAVFQGYMISSLQP